MKILVLEHELPGAATESFQRYAKEEARTVWEQHQVGVIRELYFRVDRNEAVLVLECNSTKDAEDILSGLPFVHEGLIGFDVIPLRAYPGFERLFA